MNKLNIGFVGIGIMGKHIVTHLLNISKNFNIISRKSKNTQELIKKNKNKINVYKSYKEIAENSDVLISCVGNDKDLKFIFLSKNGLLTGVRENTIIIDHTTSSAMISKEIYRKCLLKKAYFFDAPMSGGEIGAKEGKLSLMVGGKKLKFKNVEKITKFYSKSCIYMGESGNGQLTKMVNQICVASVIQGLAEGLNFAKIKKLDTKKLINVISNGAGQSWQLDNRGHTMLNNKFNFGFMNKLMLKDLNLVFDNFKNKEKLPNTWIIKKYYKKLIKLGYDKDDTSSLIRLLK